jgi:hypothetical protein
MEMEDDDPHKSRSKKQQLIINGYDPELKIIKMEIEREEGSIHILERV